ncbi:MAG: hypothetical protein M1832_004109 [Thelocarpon impressellum]|nr:MAG: hypothetical protein M1832_004109 [Thelocarpon impressellum]
MADVLTYIVHHVFLPPQLPQQDDWTNDNDAALIQCVIDAVDHYESLNPAADHAPLQHYRHMLSEMLHFRDNQGNLVTERLASSLQQLADGGLLAIHVRAQNAAVIVRRASDRYMFESFEVSPTAEDVMSTQGRLRRCFPGPAVNLEQDRIVDPCFRSAWAQLLVRLDLETPMEMCPVTVKTGAKTSEIRDTVNPAMVTQLLMGFLRALGSPGLPAPVYKNTRDDVLWKKGLKPWRRSPLWLVLRVAMQTHLMLLDEIERGHAPYKSFMLFLMARILNYALDEAFPTDVLFVMAAKITQRTLKVDPADDMPARDYIESSVRQAHEEMARRWAKLEAEPDPDHVRVQERLSRLSPMSDTALSVPKLGPYLKSVAARSAAPAARQPSVAACLARLSPVNTKLPELVIGDHDHLALTDLEVWVHQSLDGWAAAHLHDPDAGPKLATLTEMYLSAASEAYQAKPEETSVLFLVAVELWVALDRCTVCQFPLLGQYPPEIPLSVFEPLLLPDKSQMERLGRVEQYLLDRVAAATTTADRVAKGHRPSIFEAVDHADAFAVKYFDQSTRHHDLKRRIEAQATSERALHFAIENTTHTSNEALAKQSDCPDDMSLHEFYSFATLRAGARLQWRNMARELSDRVINLNRVETYVFMAQAAWQAGVRGSDDRTARENHIDLEEEGFGMSLLDRLDAAAATIQDNWQNACAVRILTLLTARLLTLASGAAVRDRCYCTLRRLRNIALDWTRDLVQRVQDEHDQTIVTDLSARALELALTCHATYNVDWPHLRHLLASDVDVAAVTESSIVIHDRCPAVTDTLSASTQALLRSHFRRCHRLEPVLRRYIHTQPNGLDETIGRLWGGYKTGTAWQALPAPDERWLAATTASTANNASMQVHFNLLDGTLLINGSPLARLPRSYEEHPTFRRLFGERILDVVPSTMSDMRFESRTRLQDHQVFFSMSNDELIVRSRKDERTYEALPLRVLEGEFPQAFVRDYVHWLEPATGRVEWRPLTNLWMSSPEHNWVMQPNSSGGQVLIQGALQLVDVSSDTAAAVASVLRPLEVSTHLHLTWHQKTRRLHVHLPRLSLDFEMAEGSSCLASRQFRGLRVDHDPSIGTLTGLSSKLVLRHIDGTSRSILVPHGKVQCRLDRGHVHVTIRPDEEAARVAYDMYRVDNQLGQLVDNGRLMSRLFRCYLHAVTASCLVDQLSGRTGTEEALAILASQLVTSSLHLGPDELQLLYQIAALTPSREYYPDQLRVMQTVCWHSKLSPLAQSPSFACAVRSIRDQVDYMRIFCDDEEAWRNIDRGSLGLHQRAAHRHATVCVNSFDAGSPTSEHDVAYLGRDGPSSSEREHHVFDVAKLVDQWTGALYSRGQLLPTMQLGDTTVAGRGVGPAFSLGYDPKWLEEPATYLPNHWVALQAALTHSDPEKDKYAVMVFLSTIAFGRHGADDLAPMLLAFATVPALRKLPLPRYDAFPLRDGAQPQYPMLRMSLRKYAWSFEHSPEARLPRLFDEDDEEADDRRREAHDKARAQSEDLFVHRLTSQFPIEYLTTPSTDGLTQYFNVGPAMEAVQPMFHAWFRNHRFLSYMSDAQVILDRLQSWAAEPRPDAPAKPDYRYRRQRRHITFEYLFSQPAPKLSAARGAVPSHWIASSHEQRDHARLRALLDSLWRESAGDHERKYSDDLEKSFEALLLNTDTTQKVTAALQKELLDEHHEQCQAKLRNATQILLEHLRPMQTMALRMSHVAQMTPRLSRVSLLQQLAHDRFGALPYEWKRALVEYGVIVTKLQQAKRLKSVAHAPAELLAELSNRGHDGWDPHQRPEWLLLELENDLLIRPRQAQIAHAMMTPSSGDNAVMQLNMGEGKSSVIVPMVAAALADGAKLVRVIVLKPLMVQMFRVLVSKFGGMLGRRIFHLPVTRSQPLNLAQARRIQAMCDECMRVGGVLLVQPEHLLSFKLMGLERLLAGETDVGNALISTRRFFDHHARDVLDESDEILSVRFELIYTMGTQRDVEFAPSRWVTIQHVLGMIRRMAPALRDMFPDGVELQDAPNGSFPRLRILDGAAGERLMNNLAHDISELGVPGLAVGTLAPVKSVLLGFLGDAKMTPSAGARLRNSAFDVKSVWQCLLLLRGLIAGGVLLFALQRKRWRVNYGLDLSRTMLAVPYRAKDDPATRAEFSHPDATIVLTCISYYYGGLSDAQLTTAIETLELCDHGQEEYDLWVHDAPKLPPQFHRLAGINLKNKSQCATVVFPALHLAKGAIDFYLSQIVFPHEMKEFPDKLSASGWDIACARTHPTTGFSGTNDSRYVLPSSIEQCDLPEQLHTNALVLQHLLQPENTLAPTPIQLDVTSLLQMVVDAKPEVRVLLDVGAQVLEWRNDEVARQWLLRVPDAQASVYFDDRNDLVVRSRDGHIESLLVSPWAEQMDQCLVYLDESHTRGTDLKLPTNYRAAVTLGPNLTKDRLVQACMRMRKLGHGQSVMFCASPEVKRHMSRWRSGCADLDVFSVLRWAIATTCRHTKESISLWALQGMRYQRHHALWSPFRNNPDRPMTGEDAKGFLEGEAQSLEDRYDLEGDGMAKLHIGVEGNGALPLRHEQVEAIRAKCEQFQLTSISHAKLQEEQERELSPEIEYERQVQRPPALEALRHKVRPDLVRLAQTGRLHPDSQAVQPAFQLLHNTSAALHLEDGAWPGDLRTTVDFARTVWAPANENLDSYLRPVHWILSWTQDERTECLIISPSEANNLLPSIRRGQLVTLHVYSARVSMSAPSLEHLAFCAVPAVAPHWRIPPSVQPLNLFAGQLYVHNYDDYVSMCRSLGLCFHPPPGHVRVAMDGFVDPADRPDFDAGMAQTCRFQQSPVEVLRMLMLMRRKGHGIDRSHMGRMLRGDMLALDDIERSDPDTRE